MINLLDDKLIFGKKYVPITQRIRHNLIFIF